MLVARRLPGIEVDVAPPPAAEALPRMDVAVFAGFAATGPTHLPVPIESVVQFAAVFGPDAPLAWDEVRGERVLAFLGPAVRAFFSNGGRRCWVIRVARTVEAEALRGRMAHPGRDDVAASNAFAIPGVLSLAAGAAAMQPAIAQARCEGSWSDSLRVAAAVSRRSFGLEMLDAGGSPASTRLRFLSRVGLRPGDLIELGDANNENAYATVESVRASFVPGGPYAVEATVCAAFERLSGAGFPASPAVGGAGTAQIHGFAEELPATLFPPTLLAAASLRFDAPVPASLERGHWACWRDGWITVWLRIDDIERTPSFPGSPADVPMTDVTVTGPAWRELDPALPMFATAAHQGHVLTIDLRVTGGERAYRLSDIGLTPGHPAAWWDHLSDADFYKPRERIGGPLAERPGSAEVERFALSRMPGPSPVAWIPLGASPLFGAAPARLPQTATALERDGLATFDADLFLDPELASASMHVLPDLADSIRFLSARPRPQLFGIHGALSVGAGGLFNEASLLGIPDAVHLGWHPRDEEIVPSPTPQPAPGPPHWHTHRGACPPPKQSPGTPPPDGPDLGVFLDCDTRALNAPVLEGPVGPVPAGAYRLRWTDSEPGAEYVLVEAMRPDFADAREVDRTRLTEYVARAQRDGVYYYQVFAQLGKERSGWSNAIAVRVRSDEWVQNRPEDAEERTWLTVHRAALRLAGGSGELFAALAMPRHFRTQQVLRYAQRLRAVREPPGRADIDAFGFTEARALSYGALYYPWLQSDLQPPGIRVGSDRAVQGPRRTRPPIVVPPDGTALGVLAARATSRGAWVAAANEPLKDVVALTPAVASSDWHALQDAQVNLVRADPRGFLVLSAETLALEPELRQITVRRLLILLRRLALRRGISYVFEPNGPTLRRAVQRGFELLLTDMFRRGAFAGDTAAQSFRVVTDDTINTPRDADAGRLIVELRVAPSVPLAFIAVRLAQSGERLTVREEL